MPVHFACALGAALLPTESISIAPLIVYEKTEWGWEKKEKENINAKIRKPSSGKFMGNDKIAQTVPCRIG